MSRQFIDSSNGFDLAVPVVREKYVRRPSGPRDGTPQYTPRETFPVAPAAFDAEPDRLARAFATLLPASKVAHAIEDEDGS